MNRHQSNHHWIKSCKNTWSAKLCQNGFWCSRCYSDLAHLARAMWPKCSSERELLLQVFLGISSPSHTKGRLCHFLIQRPQGLSYSELWKYKPNWIKGVQGQILQKRCLTNKSLHKHGPAKTPGAQNCVRTASDAPGATGICHTWRARCSPNVVLSGSHCSRCFGDAIGEWGAIFGVQSLYTTHGDIDQKCVWSECVGIQSTLWGGIMHIDLYLRWNSKNRWTRYYSVV